MSEWREQYDRMKRWRERVAHDRSDPEGSRDVFFAFTAACFHLVDWLENDRSQGIRRRQAENHVKASPWLDFCGAVCDGSKHAQLEPKGVTLDYGLSAVGSSVVVGADGAESVREVTVAKLVVWCQDRWVPVLEFADACIVAWEALLISAGLLGVEVDST